MSRTEGRGEGDAMGRLIYSAIQSLDGYVADAAGKFDWAEPDESVHTFANQLQRPIGTNLLGRRMYEVMSAWETLGASGDEPAYIEEFGELWRASDKVVYSKTLGSVSAARTRIERAFEPDAVRQMKDELAGDISIGGPTLATQAIAAGLSINFLSCQSSWAGARAVCRMESDSTCNSSTNAGSRMARST